MKLPVLIKALVDFVYPPLCLLCDREIEEGSSIVCHRCWRRLEPSDLIERRLGDTRVIAAYFYSEDIRTIIHAIKFGGKTHLAEPLGKALGELIAEDLQIIKFDAVVPVPLHKVRYRTRGFNQSELLSRAISEASGIPHEGNILIRRKYTKKQSQVKPEDREKNVRGAFRVTDPEKVEGKRLLVVDDVIPVCTSRIHQDGNPDPESEIDAVPLAA